MTGSLPLGHLCVGENANHITELEGAPHMCLRPARKHTAFCGYLRLQFFAPYYRSHMPFEGFTDWDDQLDLSQTVIITAALHSNNVR